MLKIGPQIMKPMNTLKRDKSDGKFYFRDRRLVAVWTADHTDMRKNICQ